MRRLASRCCRARLEGGGLQGCYRSTPNCGCQSISTSRFSAFSGIKQSSRRHLPLQGPSRRSTVSGDGTFGRLPSRPWFMPRGLTDTTCQHPTQCTLRSPSTSAPRSSPTITACSALLPSRRVSMSCNCRCDEVTPKSGHGPLTERQTKFLEIQGCRLSQVAQGSLNAAPTGESTPRESGVLTLVLAVSPSSGR